MSEPAVGNNAEEISLFLGCVTPDNWLDDARRHMDILLLDHANCEKKAAATAISLMFRYADDQKLLYRMSKLAREELRHFEQVQTILTRRGIELRRLGPSRYAEGLRRIVRGNDPGRLVDLLVCGAFIEARSCERFAGLLRIVDDELSELYRGLLASESRHFREYLELAEDHACQKELEDCVARFRIIENRLITEPDVQFRFHSGPPR